MKHTLALLRLRLFRVWVTMFLLAGLGTAFAAMWWEFDVLGISSDERSAYDDGMSAFTLPKGMVLKFVQEQFGLGRPKRSTDVLVVALDDASLKAISSEPFLRQRYGSNLPYDRVVWADAITYLSKAGARIIAFDMFMNEPSSDGTGELALANALAETSTPVVFGFTSVAGEEPLPKVKPTLERPVGPRPAKPTQEVQADEFPEEPTPEEQTALREQTQTEQRLWAAKAYSIPVISPDLEIPSFATEAERTSDGTLTGRELVQTPTPAIIELLEGADGFGTVTSEEDDDGKLRRTAFIYTDGTNVYPTLPVMVMARLEKAQQVTLEPRKITIGQHTAHINNDGTAEIHYGGRLADRFRMIPLVDVLRRFHFCRAREGKTNAVDHDCPDGNMAQDPQGQQFKDKIILIGGIAAGTGDSKATPLEQATPGLMKQASVIDNLLHNQFITAAPYWVSLVFAFLVALFSVALVLVVRNTFVDIGWPVLLYVGFFTITGGFLVATRIHVLSALPGLAGTAASILTTTWERLFSRKERERLKALFQNYMESDLVELMAEQKHLPNLEGEPLQVTAFFSDIKGFSTFSERLRDEPKKLIRLLNRYLSTVTPELTSQGACLDKYIGDAVVALFGAPVAYTDHALRACKAALGVQQAIARLREALRREELPDVYTRIGLNTGIMMVGNIGSEQLLDYTAVGDEMNLAARLEGANKVYGTLIMMGPGTYEAVKAHVEARELDRVRVAGKLNAVAVYELLGMRGEIEQDKRAVIDLYAQALAAYRASQFGQAKEMLQKALQLDENDGPSQRLLVRCLEFEQHPPPAHWDAVSELEK